MTDSQNSTAGAGGAVRSVLSGSSAPAPRKPAEHVADLKELVVGYAKQETVDPLKNLGRYLGWGVGGSIAVGTGSLLLLLALLRGLQSIELFHRSLEVDGGTWSFVPYLATGVAALAIIGLAVAAIARDPHQRSRRNPKDSNQRSTS